MIPEATMLHAEGVSKRLMATYRNLEWLRSKHSYFDSNADSTALQKNLAVLDSGLDKANLILKFSTCFSELEAENRLLKLRVQKLEENNAWLSEELRNAQNKLQTSEQNVVIYIVILICKIEFSRLLFFI